MFYVEYLKPKNDAPDGKRYGIRDTVQNTLTYLDAAELNALLNNGNIVFGVFEGKIRPMTKRKIFNFIKKYNIYGDATDYIKFDSHEDMIIFGNDSSYSTKEPYYISDDGVLSLPVGVEGISNYAYYNMSELKKIIITPEIKFIGSRAFKGCNNLEYVEIQSKNLKTYDEVFSNCENLAEFKIADGVDIRSWGKNIISNTKVERIDFPDNCCSAFPNILSGSNIVEITTPKGVKTLDSYAFYGMANLQKVDISNTEITVVPSDCFSNNSNLVEVKLPKGVKEIMSSAFKNCSSLKHIDNLEGIVQANQYAFRGCTALENFDNVVFDLTRSYRYSSDPYADVGGVFNYCNSITDLSVIAYNTLNIGEEMAGLKHLKVIERDESRSEMTLTISNNAFKKYASLTKIDLDPKFTEIEVYPHAFEDCANFADTEFVSKVTAFKKGRYDNEDESADTFKNCGFTEVVINAEVGWIPEGTFKDCRQLSKVTFKGNPNNISIGLTSFENTKATFDEYPELAKKFKDYKTTKAKLFFSANSMELEHRNDGIIVRGLKDPNMNRLFVPKDITKIDVYKNSEFGYSLDKVSEIQLNEGITTLGCFGYSFSNLKKINFPDSITTIDSGCNLFKSGQFDTIVLPHNVTELPEDCFYYNRQVKTVVLPKNLKTIGRRCFCGCQNLEYIVIPDGVTSIGDNAFQECTNLEAVFLPPSVISVGKSAFEGCSKLRYIIFPLNLRQIPYRCCWHCKSLEWVVVGRYTSIYDGAIKKTGVTWIELTRQEWLECTGQYPKKVEEPEEAEFDD